MLSSIIKNPDVKLVIRYVSTVLHSKLLDDMENEKSIDPKSDLYFFDEEKYIAENPSNFYEDRITLLRKVSKPDDLSGFIDALYDLAQFSGDYCDIGLIYLNHIFALTHIPILATTWRP